METRIVVMSDLHVSNCEKYAWCSPQSVQVICNMLGQVANDKSVSELVLLGDLVDLWVYPLDVVPWTMKDIVKLQGQFVGAVQECVAKLPAVSYLPGNHDMDVTEDDLRAFDKDGKRIKMYTVDDYNRQVHAGWRIEHGNDADMFNAPYDETDGIGGLPLGFFITRLTTHSPQPAQARQLLLDTLTGHLGTFRVAKNNPSAPSGLSDAELTWLGRLLVAALVDVLVIHTGVSEDAVIRFSDPKLDQQRITVRQIKSHYWKLLGKWWNKCGENIDELLDAATVAVCDNGLGWYAKKLEQSSSPPSLIVFGHTHHAESLAPYSNDGCWCYTTGQTYVAIENGSAKVVPFGASMTKS
jgi:UDP-2,3-diacylglucosamine pyrophosphatase LpxH